MHQQLKTEDIKCDNPELGRRLIYIAMLEFERQFNRKPICKLSFEPVDEIYFFTIVNLPKCGDIITLNNKNEEAFSRAIKKGGISFDEHADWYIAQYI